LLLLPSLACDRPDEGAQAQAQALQAAAEELGAARAAFEADRAAAQAELAELRKAVDAANAKLDAMAVERGRPVAARESSSASGFPLFDGSETPTEDEAAAAAAVRCESETRCTIDRAYVETLAIDPTALMKQARIVPGMHDGTMPKALGLKNGDLVRSVDGKALTSMDETMKIFTELRHARTFTLELERRGSPLALTIEIVDGA
jgi:general secretion pathway protein C